MNTGMKILYSVTWFATGCIVGGCATYAYIKKHNVIEYEYIKPEGSEETQNEESEEEKPEVKVEEADDSIEEGEIVDADIMAYYNEAANNVDSTYIDYAAVARPKVEDIPKKKPNIFEISEDEFVRGELGYDKATYALYEGDGQLVDETDKDDHMVDDIRNTISDELFEKFQNDPDADAIYVRNLMYGTDYEVYKRAEKYSELIGMDEEEVEE